MKEPLESEVIAAISAGLKKLRHEKGLSQRAVLYDTGIHIARIEARIKSLKVITLKRLCSYYEITLREFFEKYCQL